VALKGKSRTIFLVSATLLAAAVAYYDNHRGPAHADHAASSAAAASLTPASPLPMRHWQLGALDLTSCELPHVNSGATTAAWCTNFDVAEDPAQPGGRHIGLRVAVIRSTAAKPEPDVVVMIAGGPGESATQDFADTTSYAGVLKHHNVLLVDQRGTGGSNALSCEATAKAAREQGPVNDLINPEEIRKGVEMCLAEVQKKADPRFYTTTLAVDDLEKLRVALGSPRFDLFGGSYGTRVAQQYLMHHPEAVRSVVLDSVVPNQAYLGQDFAAKLDAALKLDFADCLAAPACKQAFGDPMVTLYKLRDSLRASPREVSFRDPRTFETVSRRLTANVLVGVVHLYAYNQQTAALLPLSIDAAAHGDVAPLLGQQRLQENDLAGDINNGMSTSVLCTEDADHVHERPEDADTILGNLIAENYKNVCGAWPHGAVPDDFHTPLRSDKPVLILSGSRDPVTPPEYGEQVMQGLGNARHLVLKGHGHATFRVGCVPKLIEQFFDDPDPKKLDASCLDRLGPTPPFVGFNGAAP
jgi:pimeloyl-ACP methyl ester carboxylesterase